jgi:UDP-glucuronate 4-epimerase
MRVLITGGAGFIANHVASALMQKQAEVSLLDNFNDFYNPEIKRRNVQDLQARGPVQMHIVDILDRDRLKQVFETTRPDAIVHLAAWAGVRPSLEKPELYCSVNITGTVNLLELAREYCTKCFVFGSSSSVYGGNTKVPFSEDDPVDKPISPYAATKRAGELLCHTYAHNFAMNITCLRFFTVYGPRQRPEMAIHKFATITLMEVVEHLESALGKKAQLRFLPNQPGDMEATFADISRARRILGYNPQKPFKEGIRLFAEWFKNSQ